MTVGGAISRSDDCTTVTDAMGGGGTPAKSVKHPMQHELLQSL
jgi:hypothetical protein